MTDIDNLKELAEHRESCGRFDTCVRCMYADELNAAALASELEAARKVVAEHRWRHDDEECVCKPAEMGFDGIKDARLCSVAEYLRVMEEQR